MFFKFKYASKLEKFLEYVNGFAGYAYYIWWLFVLVTLITFFVLKIFNAVDSCLKTIAILWLSWIPLSIVFYIYYIVSKKGVLVNENEVKIILNHPTMFSIKLKRFFYVSDIKNITYVDSETNRLYRKICEHNQREQQEFISRFNDFLYIKLNDGKEFVISIDDNVEFINTLKQFNENIEVTYETN